MINKLIAMVFLVAIVAACKPKDSTEAKKAKLEKLKKELQAKQQEISALEKELKVGPDESQAKNMVAVIQTKDTVFKHYVEVQGKVESEDNVFLTPKIPGTVLLNLYVKRGDKVRKGQLLATQESAALAETIASTQTQYDFLVTAYKKQKNLWDQKIGSEMQFLNAKTQMESTSKLLAGLQAQLSNFSLRSPIDGTVDDIDASLKPGQIPIPGVSGIRIVNYASSKVIADVSENYSSSINVGDEVFLNYPDIKRTVNSKITAVAKAIDALGRTFKIQADPGPNVMDLHPNMIAIVKINDYTNAKAKIVPINVIQNNENGQFVYVVVKEGNQDIARKKPVSVGRSYNGMTEILSGVSDTDHIISAGYQNVVDGQPVNL